jgi:hypothetical protein
MKKKHVLKNGILLCFQKNAEVFTNYCFQKNDEVILASFVFPSV